ncbi:NHL repeat-containing protein [candidate division KSB1 bacterium]|nr:NHL repeat-containing protein [candidate division KSB1 bacterium]
MKKQIFLLYILWSMLIYAQETTLTFEYISCFGQKGEKPGEFRLPQGISTDINGNVYIADTGNNRIQKFDAMGNLISFIGGFGWSSEQFNRPTDIYAERGLNVFVADYENNRIEMYDKDLNYISSFYSNSSLDEKLQFKFPKSIASSIHNDLFIIDTENTRVLKLNSSREPEFSFADFDWGEGNLIEPEQIFLTRDDQILVTDRGDQAIKVYDYYGNYLNNIRQELVNPCGITISDNNVIYVTDVELDKILAFDISGRRLGSLGSAGEKIGAFNNPHDIAVYKNHVYILDTGNHRVQVFKATIFK